MGRPRKLETLTKPVTGRIRNEQAEWLRREADKRFEGELSRALRWALDQGQVMTVLLESDDPVMALDRMLHPEKYEPPHPEDAVAEADRELEQWKREQAINRARQKGRP
jgi:exoribonuclease R